MTRGRLVVGIDAGGSSTRVRAIADDRVVYEGRGGPGNPLAVEAEILAESYRAALAGCPEPTHVAACVSGTAGHQQQQQIVSLLSDRFSSAVIRVHPDYVAAMYAAPEGTEIVVIAGTGSVVCSASPAGGFNVSGGRGWILGDRGSAARLGQAALEWYCNAAIPDPGAAELVREYVGFSDWRQIVAALNASKCPAALLARAAPLLTQAAEHGADWAVAALSSEMAWLAASTANHIARYLRSCATLQVALAGGVWISTAARSAFKTALAEHCPASPLLLAEPLHPIDGATNLAESMAG